MVPPYDPDPYCVVEVRGHQITAMRKGKTIKRDAQKWKLVGTSQEEADSSEEDTIDDSDCEGTAGSEVTQFRLWKEHLQCAFQNQIVQDAIQQEEDSPQSA